MTNYTELFWESLKRPYLLKEVGEYSVSSSPKTILFDFYLLSYLSTLNLDIGSKNWKGSFIGKDTDEIKSLIEDAEDKLLPKLKSEMLDAVFFAICAESRHMGWAAYDTINTKSMIESDPLLKDYKNILSLKKLKRGDSISLYQLGNDIVNTILHKHGAKPYDFVKSIRNVFNSFVWSKNYGGDAWRDICDGWIRLYNATSKKDIYVAIDHIYDLQHNTGSVFTKVQKYHIKGSTYWLKAALDLKANITDIHELMPRVSSDMRKIAQSALKAGGINPLNPSTKIAVTTQEKADLLIKETKKIIEDHRKEFPHEDLIINADYNPTGDITGDQAGEAYVNVDIEDKKIKHTLGITVGSTRIMQRFLSDKKIFYSVNIIISQKNLHENRSFMYLKDALPVFRDNLRTILLTWRDLKSKHF